jgi:hypothetical protein
VEFVEIAVLVLARERHVRDLERVGDDLGQHRRERGLDAAAVSGSSLPESVMWKRNSSKT